MVQKILINSLPKSGTNFAEQILRVSGLNNGRFSLSARGLEAPHRLLKIALRNRVFLDRNFIDVGIDFTRPYSYRYIERSLRKISGNCFITAHANFSYLLDSLLSEIGFSQIIMIRHPEEVLRSYIQYAQDFKGHLHHRAHINHTPDELATAHVTGGRFGVYFLDPWAVRLDRVVQWKRFSDNCHFVKYEDLCATASEGRMVGTAALFIKVGLQEDKIVMAIRESFGNSKTYRSGTIRNKSFFSTEVRKKIANASADFCDIFQYER